MENTRKELAAKLLDSLQLASEQEAACDATAVLNSLDQESLQLNQLPIKIVSILGGLISALLFTAFLLVLGLWQSGAGLCILGVVFTGSALLVISQDVSTYFSATAIAFLFIGLMLFGAGVGISSESVSMVCVSLIFASGLLFACTTHGLVLFLITLVFFGSWLVLLLDTEAFALLHLFVALLSYLLLACCLSETKLITASKWQNEAYRPIRMGIIFSFACLMVFLASTATFDVIVPLYWLSGLLLLIALFAFAWFILQDLQLQENASGAEKDFWYLLLPLLMLPLIPAPAVIGSFLLILLGFYIRHLPSLVVGIAAFCYALFLFYYDLQLSLLQKSGMLLLSGGWFLVGYILIRRHAK